MKWPAFLLYGILSSFWLGAGTLRAEMNELVRAFLYAADGLDAPSWNWSAVSKLPAGIQGEAGKVTLVADFKAAKGHEAVPVYLINLSDKEIKLSSQDGDVYLKQETRGAAGVWVRSQAHDYSDCGNSYVQLPGLPSGHYIKIPGYQAIKGAPVLAPVRYRLYQNELDLATEEGTAFVDLAEVKRASRDFLSLKRADLPLLRQVLSPCQEGGVRGIDDLKPAALRRLSHGSFDRPAVEALLKKAESQYPYLQTEVQSARRVLKHRAEAEATAKAAKEASLAKPSR